jgi:sulfite reductase (NADPH) hemoprotein beta-component
MVGGGAAAAGAAFGQLAAKIPARRIADAVDRLIALYAREREEGEPATAFFGRVAPAVVRSELEDLERLQLQDAVESDFIDLGDAAEFAPVVMDGECSA